ncbi:Fic family protein [Microgenomates group bacterium]|nr:Fic family protein [Microgenomates group bacterium]
MELTKRQQFILNQIISAHRPLSIKELKQLIITNYDISRDTLGRELTILLNNGFIKSIGLGPATTYSIDNNLLSPIDAESYFATHQDSRQVTTEPNLEFFHRLSQTNLTPDISVIDRQIIQYQAKITDLPPDIRQKELERFVIDLAYKSSAIEGNTYTLLETEILIKTAQRATGHDEKESLMILNHKTALDLIIKNPASFKHISLNNIIDIHRQLTFDLGVNSGIRRHAVGISGTNYRPLDNEFALREHLERAIEIVNKKTNPIEKAIIISGLIIYLQPFADGNKRTARMTANAVLLAYDIAPISYRNIDELYYKKAAILIDEQHNFYHYCRIMLDSLIFSLDNYAVRI